MKTEKNILIAFVLNLFFSIFELLGGAFTGSVAIVSDALHDMGDAISIGVAFLMERKSKRQPNEKYTYGYARYSVLGGAITSLILLCGSFVVIYSALTRIVSPTRIDYDGMIIFAVVGACVNFVAVLFTREGESLNQRAVNLHMLEDVLGWVAVLVGAIVMRFTDFYIIDPLISIGVALFILINAVKGLREVLYLFLERTPSNIDMKGLKEHIMKIDGVTDVHHIHIWSIDGQYNCATMHIVASGNFQKIKREIREELNEHGIHHATLELEDETEHCCLEECKIEVTPISEHHHHHK